MSLIEYKHEVSCSINDFLENANKKCLIISTKNSRNLDDIFKNIETDYVFTDTYYNVSHPLHLLFLLRQQRNPEKRATEFNFFINKGLIRFSPVNLFKSVTNVFKQDIKYFEEQVASQIKEFHSKIVVPICCHDGIDNSVYDLLEKLCAHNNLVAKFILIFEDKTVPQIYMLKEKDFNDYMEVEFETSMLQSHFEKLSCEQIETIKLATNDDLLEMERIYMYLSNSDALISDTSLVVNDIVKSIVERNFTTDKSRVLGIAAYFKDKFTLEGLEYVCDKDSVNQLNTEIENVLEDSIRDGILDVSDEEYVFIIGMLKDALKQIYKSKKNRFHSAIESYLKDKNPFQYDIRYYHLKEIQSKNAKDMLLMKVINALRFKKDIDLQTKTAFIENFDLQLFDNLISVYSMIDKGDFNGAWKKCTSINVDNNLILHSEIKYLTLFLEWKCVKRLNSNLLISNFNEINSLDCEIETKIFTKLLQLSIACNEGNRLANFPTPTQIFHEINCLLSKYNCLDALYLKYILYRKSNAALNRISSLNNVKASFEYFEDKKELYPNEYFMSGTNLVALLLQSATKLPNNRKPLSKDRDPYTLAKILRGQLSSNCPPALSVNLENNYLIAKEIYTTKLPTENELQKLIKQLNGIGHGSSIMTYMNIGTIYALHQNYNNAIQYWNKAEEINEENDEYFTYILKSNKLILRLSQNQKVNPDDFFPEEIPAVFADNEVIQYITLRQDILRELIGVSDLTYNKIKKYFYHRFNEAFNGLELQFFSQPYILSDVQFWSDN